MMDYIGGMRQRERQLPTLTLKAQANLLRVSPGSVEVFRNRHGLKGPTTALELADVSHRRWPAGVCLTAGKNLSVFTMPDHLAISDRLEPEPQTAFMIYDALFRFNWLVADGLNREAAVSSVAQTLNLSVATLDAWLNRGKHLMQQPVHEGTHRSRFSRNPLNDAQDVAFKDGLGGVRMPELPECLAPPKAEVARGLVEDIFERVGRWLREEPEMAYAALRTVTGAISSSKTQISFTKDRDKRAYLEFLERAGLKHLTRVRVRAPERELPDRVVKAHWSDQFKVPKARVVIASEVSRGHRFPFGSAQVEVKPEPKLGKSGAQNTMNALRFAVFTLMLSCAGDSTIEKTFSKEVDHQPSLA
ncbi:hypothetical protein [Marinobacter sp. F4216]|uniref:hypothetical protein n=1 Tax=Marinobacter sp. F4216 TaxID=2874281 RepID=UPI001CBB528B|nr:hypothetical protein [Marinobacter sp. F4216]MBZ2170258.1 hypothetical protein [Marinobacter sp. F4216]